MNECAAITRLKQGDVAGLEYLVQTHQLNALRRAYLIVHDHHLAQDIVQNAFLRVYERIHTFDQTRPFAPWLSTIVANLALNTLRTKETAELDDELPSLDWSVEATMMQAKTNTEILHALRQLSPEQRVAIVQRYFLDMSERDMAEQANCAPGTIKWRLHHAKKRLRELLSAQQ